MVQDCARSPMISRFSSYFNRPLKTRSLMSLEAESVARMGFSLSASPLELRTSSFSFFPKSSRATRKAIRNSAPMAMGMEKRNSLMRMQSRPSNGMAADGVKTRLFSNPWPVTSDQ